MNVEPIRKILPYTTILVVVAALYVAYTFYTRHDEQQRVERAAAERETEAGRDSLNRVGGGELKILQFFSTPAVVTRGQAAKLCYGVAFAKSVRIEPATETVWPSLSRCLEVRPSKTTHSILTAEDGKGNKKSQAVDLVIQ